MSSEQVSTNIITPNSEDCETIEAGVSGASVKKVYRSSGWVVIKSHQDIGIDETNGRNLLSPYLKLPEVLEFDDNSIVYPYIPGPNLDQLATISPDNALGPIRNTLTAHVAMWNSTCNQEPATGGYVAKIAKTEKILWEARLAQNSLTDLATNDFIINGVKIGKINQALYVLKSTIESAAQRGSVLTHGDEGWNNHILAPTGEVFSIDFGTAGRRIPGEAIAKFIGWFPAVAISALDYNLFIENGQALLTTETKLDPSLASLVKDGVLPELQGFIDTQGRSSEVAACLMTYFIRELQWLKKRGREEMEPHLIAMALSCLPAIMNGKLNLSFLE